MLRKKGFKVLACILALMVIFSSISVFAASVKTGKLRVEVTGGAGFTISVDGGSARPQGAVYHNSKMTVGSTVTLTVKEIPDATFLGWINPVNGTVISSDYSYTFVASGNDYLNAMYNTQVEGIQMVMFKNNKSGAYGKFLEMQYYAADDTISFPTAPTQVGFDFAGWSMTESEIKSTIAAGKDVTIAAEWTRQIIPVNVTVNGGTGTGTYNANAAVTAVANAAPEGQKFAYWTDAQGNIKSYSEKYVFYPSADTTVTAVFVDESVEVDYQILVSVDNADTTTIADKTSFTYSWYCPEEFEFVRAGILAANKDNYNEETFYAGTSDSNVYDRNPAGANNTPVNTYVWTKSNVTSGQVWVAKAYVQYRDVQGNIVTVYSDMIEAVKD